MYCNHPNQGMRCIKKILDDSLFPVEWTVYDVRSKNEIPRVDYDVYIFSGGPGNPLEADNDWDKSYYNLIDSVFEHNQKNSSPKKFAFFICHAFQMVCHHLKVAEVNLRKSPAFGIFPVHKTAEGEHDVVLKNLPEPFYAVDSRDWQVVQPDEKKLSELGAKVLSLEKIRTHVPYERAVMSIRFSDELFGTQFHPEADVIGMDFYFKREDKKNQIIKNHGEQKYQDMIASLNDKDKIQLTHQTILPQFINSAFQSLRQPD